MFPLQFVFLLPWSVLTADAVPLSLAAAPVVDLGYELHQATVNVRAPVVSPRCVCLTTVLL